MNDLKINGRVVQPGDLLGIKSYHNANFKGFVVLIYICDAKECDSPKGSWVYDCKKNKFVIRGNDELRLMNVAMKIEDCL